MSHDQDGQSVAISSAPLSPSAAPGSMDSRVVSALEEYLKELEAGRKPDRDAWVARFPQISEALSQALLGLEFVHSATPSLHPSASPAELPHGEMSAAGPLGDFRILREIGRGGMGVVYEAEQISLGRRVALKVLPFAAALDAKQLQRFKNEAQAAAHLHHSNIVPVHAVGCERGVHFFAMQFIEGRTLADVIRELHEHSEPRESGPRPSEPRPLGSGESEVPLPDGRGSESTSPGAILATERSTTSPAFSRTVAQLGVQAAEALEHAHSLGIIHRDIKPANLLVETTSPSPLVGESRGEGIRLWITDFGLAHIQSDARLTMSGDVLGTLRYMSPEQALAKHGLVDHRTDLYSLGATLYEFLALEPALNGKDREEILRQIAFEEPRPLQRVNPAIPHDLETIVLKAMAKEPGDRYATAQALADDLRRFLEDKPIRAKRPTLVQRARKWGRRHRGVVRAVTVSAVILLVLAVAGLAGGLLVISREKEQTKQALERETQAKEDLLRALYFHRITLAHHDLSADNLGRALKLLEECPEDLREWEWHYLMRLCRVEPLILRDKTEVNGVAFSPDGERLASAGGGGAVKVWNSRTGDVVQAFPAHTDAVLSVAFHREGKHLASRGADRKVKVWDLTATGQAVWTEPCDAVRKFGTAYTVAFSADGRQLAAGTDRAVNVWDWKKRQLLHRLPGHNFHSIPVAFSGDGRLATGSFREGLKLWDAETGILLRTVPSPRHPASALAFSPDGVWLASANFGRTVELWDSTTGRLRHTFDLHTGNVECVAFSPNGRRLASGGEDKTVRVWDATTGREVLGLHGHTERCACVAFSPDGRRLASASADGTIRIWDGTPLRGDEGRQETLTFTEHSDEIRSVAFSPDGPDGRRIASAGHDGLVKVWDAQTGRVSAEFSGHEQFSGIRGVVFCVAWHPKGHLIASGSLDTVMAWDARTEREVFRLPAAPGNIALPYQAVAFSPDGRYLVTGKMNGALQVWDAGTGQEVGTLDTHSREIRGVVFSKGGDHLASASSDGIVKLWDAKRLDKKRLDEKKGARLTLRARVAGPSLNVAFSPDGRRLATGGEANTVKIWDGQDGRELQTLRGHKGDVYTVAFSPDDDGRLVASAGEDSIVKVWDSHTGKLVRSFRGHTGLVSSLAFSPDGRRLVSGSRDKTVKVWDVTPLSDEVGDR